MKTSNRKKNKRLNFFMSGQHCPNCKQVIGQDYVPAHMYPKSGKFVCQPTETT